MTTTTYVLLIVIALFFFLFLTYYNKYKNKKKEADSLESANITLWNENRDVKKKSYKPISTDVINGDINLKDSNNTLMKNGTLYLKISKGKISSCYHKKFINKKQVRIPIRIFANS